MRYLIGIIFLLIFFIGYLFSTTRRNKRTQMTDRSATLDYEPLINYARSLGYRHHVVGGRYNISFLLGRMNANYRYISAAYRRLTTLSVADRRITGADEWLLDNFYIIEEQTKDLKQNIKKKDYAQLPVIKDGKYKGYPRVFAIALELVSHTDSVITQQMIVDFIDGYQKTVFLTDTEIWAISTMLRIALMENIRQICHETLEAQEQYKKAHELYDGLLGARERSLEQLSSCLRLSLNENSSLFERLISLLRRERAGAASLRLIEMKLKKMGNSPDVIIGIEHQKQAARQVSMGNIITSLRLIITFDYVEIFGALSQVEHILNEDPAGVFEQMDAKSKNNYRRQVQRIAKKYDITEVEVARRAVELAQTAQTEVGRHIGYYLLEQDLDHNNSKQKRRRTRFYTFFCISLTLALSATFGWLAIWLGGSSRMGAVVALLSLIPSSDVAINLINYIITHHAKPYIMPRIEFDQGIPDSCATMAVISTLLTSREGAQEIAEKLESYYLSNREKNLFFGVLSDFSDHKQAEKETDTPILAEIIQRIEMLNQKYAEGGQLFFLFHRKRIFNEKSGKYMGYERKRGAIVELNRLLRGVKGTTFSHLIGDIKAINKIKYVITLDSDTWLTRGIAKELIGAMNHPLNKPVIHKQLGRVISGYGLIQPRINIDITSANMSPFSQIVAGQGGIDAYSGAVSDIYQDLFGEGIFTGKGIFDVDVFYQLLNKSIKDNTILSHDLLEGSIIRCGLITDISFTDGFPWRINTYAGRAHRWIRGDWQLLPWLFKRNALSGISRWKIADNLRRSTVPIMLSVFVLLAFNILPGNSTLWISLAAAVLCFNLLISTIEWATSSGFRYLGQKCHATIIYGIRGVLYQAAVLFILLPYNAFLAIDAIIRTLWRVLVSHKNMLEWVTAADSERISKNGLASYYMKMWSSVVFGILLAVFASKYEFAARVMGLLWATAPFIAWYMSKPIKIKKPAISVDDQKLLRQIARRTWQYFEDFVSPVGNYLPPDNFQENPPNGVAWRTSPTNIGIHLVSALSAHDFGFITTTKLINHLSKTIESIEKLEKWKGHLYNWYDLETMAVMRPRFISTVDSGNFVGYLIALKEGLIEIKNKSELNSNLIHTLFDLAELTGVQPTQHLKDLLSKELTKNTFIDALDSMDEVFKKANNHWSYIAQHSIADFINAVKDNDHTESLDSLVARVQKMIDETQFSHLFDTKRELMSIGYNVEDEQLTRSYYDLLASEARQASYIAIALGAIDKKHWFTLGRTLVSRNGYRGLVSWTGTMFEYLMPLLLMKNIPNTLMDETYHFVVRLQQHYGNRRGVPWGTSESGFNSFDVNLNYQYRAFGVPDLGLKRGLISDMVVAPYATIMALMVDYSAAIGNLKSLYSSGFYGHYGLYEAIDYTPERILPSQEYSVVKSYMVHHHGMSMLALNNLLHENIMQERFHRDVYIRSAEDMLGERVPTNVIVSKENREHVAPLTPLVHSPEVCFRTIEDIDIARPNMHILSNSHYSVILADNGCGYSKYKDTAITRWKNDLLHGIYGNFIFIKDVTNNKCWTTTRLPFNNNQGNYRTVFSPHKAEYYRTDEDKIDTLVEVIVSPEESTEIRRLTIANHSENEIVLEITSYQEIVLTTLAADTSHPAFSNLFVRTEYDKNSDTLIANRRPRDESSGTHYALHTLCADAEVIGSTEFETNRGKFMGRLGSVFEPSAIINGLQFENTIGAVLDPCFALKKRIKLEPGRVSHLVYITAYCADRVEINAITEKFRDYTNTERAFELAWTRSRIENQYLGLSKETESMAFKLLPHLIYLLPQRVKLENFIADNNKGQQSLWSYGISGDIPIMTVDVSGIDRLDMVGDIVSVHELWRIKGVSVDLVLIAHDNDGYSQPLTSALKDIVSASRARESQSGKGGIFVLSSGNLPVEDKTLIYAASRVVLSTEFETIDEQLDEPKRQTPEFMEFIPSEYEHHNLAEPSDLEFFNGYGGFKNREYVIYLKEGVTIPLPWVNVVSNHRLGFVVSESGGGYTWSVNSRENKLTPWSNDPVSDIVHEVVYLRDDHSGKIWTTTPMPLKSPLPYVVRHGIGYSAFEHIDNEIKSTSTVFVSEQDSVKITNIVFENLSNSQKSLTLTYYINPVLGVNPEDSQPYLTTKDYNGTILINNNYNREFAGRTAFVSMSDPVSGITCSKTEFFGNSRGDEPPDGVKLKTLSGICGSGLNPCVAMQTQIQLPSKGKHELVLILGQEMNVDDAIKTADKYRTLKNCKTEFERVKKWWNEVTGTVKVTTPDNSMNQILNGWLTYQILSCRIWGRSAFYQSGGAVGFRDQLQDVLSIMDAKPLIAKRQILQACAHQFIEGDVQHWWHPSEDEPNSVTMPQASVAHKGVRTRFSDDLLWLPYAVSEYIYTTGDQSILDIEISYIEDELLPEHESERYSLPKPSKQRGNVFDHCIRAIERSLHFGEHGIPLMGSGDWNDGMSAVGHKGKGESVWLGWFLCTVLNGFSEICDSYGRADLSTKYKDSCLSITKAIEEHAWDGAWYRRAYFDDGTPMGSAQNTECRIDSISQSWSIISGMGDKERARQAMESVLKHLVSREDGIVKLLTPAFDNGDLSPGYIKSYVPGVRENGGQYTHAATWVVLAFTMLNMGDTATEMFSYLNPINHTRTPIEAAKYKTEPYVVAADVYSAPDHVGRGGWTWYTGAAGWLHRVAVEGILGIKRQDNVLHINPCIPSGWEGFEAEYTYGKTVYKIKVKNNQDEKMLSLDKKVTEQVFLTDDGKKHEILLNLKKH